MALYEMAGESLNAIDPATFTELGLLERKNIQRSIRTQINAITPNVKTMVLAEEFGDWVGANRRIDLLCLDEHANLVVVELKRDDAAHMELQALRYAAMVSTMRFEQAVEAHRKYLVSVGSDADPAQAIREFLDVDEGEPMALSDKVRIVLASAEFSTELTTAVLWLNKQGLDLRCVQMRPHRMADRVLLDIQQVIPLPQAEQYQVAVREKSMEQDAARTQDRDLTRYDLTIGNETRPNLAKRRLMQGVVTEAIKQGLAISQIAAAVPWRGNMFISADGKLNQTQFLQEFKGKKLRYFTADNELFGIDGKTYALSKMWGERTLEAIDNLVALLPQPGRIAYAPASGTSVKIDQAEQAE
ncbi:hypothetical protein [Herbaspirillum huttiense]|uniref:hypothetical protein n=1 Tax=Herbaspirillum huttiense TaxID=863372 RepID=UPI0031D313A0